MKNKKDIMIILLFFLLNILLLGIRIYGKYIYLNIINNIYLLLFILSFILFTLVCVISIDLLANFVMLKISKNNTSKDNNIVIILLIIIVNIVFLLLNPSFFLILFDEPIANSETTDVHNYYNFDDIVYHLDLNFLPNAIPSSASNIKYYYSYSSKLNDSISNINLDINIEFLLNDDEYKLEKDRINNYCISQKNKCYIESYKLTIDEMAYNYFKNSSIEYQANNSTRGLYYRKGFGNDYIFVAFFDTENKIMYNISYGSNKPYFMKEYNNSLFPVIEIPS